MVVVAGSVSSGEFAGVQGSLTARNVEKGTMQPYGKGGIDSKEMMEIVSRDRDSDKRL